MNFCARRAGLLLCAGFALAGAFAAPGVSQAASVDQATAYQLDAAHDGYQSGGAAITTPLTQAWSDTLVGTVSYPLIVNGVVYVTAADGAGTTLYSINQATGAIDWSRTIGSNTGLTYDAGQIFTVSGSGTMTAFDAVTGVTNWSVSLPGQYSFSSAPTAYDGIVYTGGAGSGGTVYAVSESHGAVLWAAGVENGDASSPAVDSNGVYVTYACSQDYDFAPLSGSLIWHHSTDCEGGGGATPVLANGSIYGRDNGDDLILSASAGTQLGIYSTATVPAAGAGSIYTEAGGTLTDLGAWGLGTNIWSSSGTSGDGTLDTAPLLADGLLLEGSNSGELYAFDPGTGTIDWSGNVGAPFSAPSDWGGLTGLGAGENTIVVPASGTLAAYTGANVGSGTPTDVVAPRVSGKPQAGFAVGADVGVWTALPSAYTYQWYLCDGAGANCHQISGANGEAYVPPAADDGDTLEVAVAAAGAASSVTSGASAQIVAALDPPVNQTVPVVSGTPTVGQQLTVSNGTWSGNPTSFSYSWLKCVAPSACSAITGASTNTLTVTSALEGDTLEAQVVATNADGPGVAVSAQTSVVPTPSGGSSGGPTPTSLTLTASLNPAAAGATVVFTATLSQPVDAGSITFYMNGAVAPGCDNIVMDSEYIGVTCTVPDMSPGTWNWVVRYSGDGSFGSSSASLTEVVRAPTTPTQTTPTYTIPSQTPQLPGPINPAGSGTKQRPASVRIGGGGPKGKPSVALVLTAVRTGASPYRYWFAIRNVHCASGASGVLVTVLGHHRLDRCSSQVEFASQALAVHRFYDVQLQAVRLNHSHNVVARGRAYVRKYYLPGDEVNWGANSLSRAPSGHAARLVSKR